MLLREEPETYRDAVCRIRFWQPARGLHVVTAEGILTDGGAAVLERKMMRTRDEVGSILSFNDWERVEDYELAARLRLTRASARMLLHLEGGHLLVRSRLVLLGVKMSSVVLQGKLTAYVARPAFERALAEALAARGRRDLAEGLRRHARP